MTRERPLGILILGLLNLLVAGLCLFAGVAKVGRSLLFQALGPGQREEFSFGGLRQQPVPDLETYLELEIPGYAGWEIGAIVAAFLAGLVLFAIGYGLLHMRPWAYGLTPVYFVAILVWQIAYALFQLRDVLPVADLYFLDESWRTYYWMPSTFGLARKSFVFFTGAQAFLLIGHAGLDLLVLWMPSVRAAFRGQAGSGEPASAIVSGTAVGSV